MKNFTIIAAVILAIITATAAVMLRPIHYTGVESEETTETTTEIITCEETTTEKLTESTKTEPSRVFSTTEVNLPSETEKRTESTTERKESKIESKIVSLIDKTFKRETTTEAVKITPAEFRRAGVIYYNDYIFKYYSEKVLPGEGLKIPGRHSDGNFVRDENGYICVASSDLPKGTVVDTPFGKGKVYDTGCSSGVIDVYVSW